MNNELEVVMELEDALISGEKVYLDSIKQSVSPYVDICELQDAIIKVMKTTNKDDAWEAVRELQRTQVDYLKSFKVYK